MDPDQSPFATSEFGFHCLVLGYLIGKSTFVPRIPGALIALAGLCYLTNSLAYFLSPALSAQLYPAILLPSFVGELALTLSLLVLGVNAYTWASRQQV